MHSNESTSIKWPKTSFLALDHSKIYFCDFRMTLHDLVMLPYAGEHLVLSHYAISSRSNRPKSRKWPKPLFWLFGSFKNELLWHLNDPSWSGNVVECWKTFSTITLCNIKSIQQIKLQKMAKNLFFGSLDHSKMHFRDFWMIVHDLVRLPNPEKDLVPSQSAISSRSNRPKSRKWPKTFFWRFGSVKNAF